MVIERRVGSRSQLELAVPFNVRRALGRWHRGLGDVAIGFKHVLADNPPAGFIVSAGSDVTFPTGKETEGLGNRLTVVEPFGSYSQALPGHTFVHLQLGFEMPINVGTANDEIYWRGAAGKSFIQGAWGRTWSPLVEVLGNREAESRYPGRTTASAARRPESCSGARKRTPLAPRASPAARCASSFEGSRHHRPSGGSASRP